MPRASIVELNAARPDGWRKNRRRWTPDKTAKMMLLFLHNEGTEYSTAEVAEALDLEPKLVLRYVRAMRLIKGNKRLLYVATWKNARTDKLPLWVPIYVIGSKPDAKRPPKRTKAEWNEMRREQYHRKKKAPVQSVLTTVWGVPPTQQGDEHV